MTVSNYSTEAEALEEMQDDGAHGGRRFDNPHKGIRTVDNKNRYRCLIAGCNPVLNGDHEAAAHKAATGHRTAKWPVRSAAGERKHQERNRNGYYDKYNTGAKSFSARKHLIGGN